MDLQLYGKATNPTVYFDITYTVPEVLSIDLGTSTLLFIILKTAFS